MQKWEYCYIWRSRGWEAVEKGNYYHWAGNWSNFIYTPGGKSEKKDDEILDILNQLGDQGWELMAVSPRSDVLGGVTEIRGFTANIVGGGKTEGLVTDYAGYTSTEVWIFKRPKS